MEEFIIKKINVFIVFAIMFGISCNNNHNIHKIPEKIIEKSLYIILNDSNYKHLKKEIRVERNSLINDIPFKKINTFNIEMLNKQEDNSKIYSKISSFYFYKYTTFADNGDVEIEFTLYPSKDYFRLFFKQTTKNDWKCTEKQKWNF